MIPKQFLLFFLLLLSTETVAQFTIHGAIVDAEDKSPLPGATVTNLHDSLLAITDAEGKFQINLLMAGTLVFRYVGYKEKQIKVAPVDNELNVMLQVDNTLLNEVKVVAYEAGRPLQEVAGGISVIQKQDMAKFNQSSMVSVLSQVAGVRMEERSTGSYRISIRGSALRAPFDVRNVKVYWNNIPFTEPGGSTPFNLLDNSNFGRIEIIKGPSASIYGAGIGGVISIENEKPFIQGASATANFTAGSYGLRRYTLSANTGDEEKSFNVNYASQQSDGYRDQSAVDRKNLSLSGVFNLGGTNQFRANVLYTDLFYEIPGGLTKQQMEENPRQARPGNKFVLGSVESDASVAVKNMLAGVSYETRAGDKINWLTTLYADVADFENPFNLDYKREAQQGYGGRSRLNLRGNISTVPTKLTVGGEYQFRFAAARNYGNNYGKPDTLNFDDELRTSQYLIFGQYEAFLPANWILTAGISANTIDYDIYRLVDSNGANGDRIKTNFETQWMPRISFVKNFDKWAWHGSVGFGFSPPTLEEVRTNEGSINTNLQPEKGVNYETGVRGRAFHEKLSYDLTLFYLKLSETIVDYPSDRGTDLFKNAGRTNQKGIEAALNYAIFEDDFSFFSSVKCHVNYTWHYFKFKDYVQRSEDFSGKFIPGVAPHTIWSGIDLVTSPGLYLNLSYNYTANIPLNDSNDVYAKAYHLVLGKMGYKRKLGKFQLDIFLGVNNFLDQHYSLGNDLNAFGERYYQPAPSKNYYGGVALGYTF